MIKVRYNAVIEVVQGDGYLWRPRRYRGVGWQRTLLKPRGGIIDVSPAQLTDVPRVNEMTVELDVDASKEAASTQEPSAVEPGCLQ